MNVKVENMEKNMAKLTITVEAARFDDAIQSVYQKKRGSFRLPGFRKGKAPLAVIEKIYGPQIFYEDAFNEIIEATYPDAVKESDLFIVSRPEIGVETLEKGKDLVYTALVAVRPEVTLGEYKGITVERTEISVSDEDIEDKLRDELEKNARIVEVEREVRQGDIATIDFKGTIDGVEFAGGNGEDYPLTIGSGTFIPGFEDQLVGVPSGGETDVKVTFPSDYGAKEVAGKDAVFHVVVKNVKEKQIPEADDDFASDVSEFSTLDEYKEDLRKGILAEKEKAATTQNENKVINKAVENAEMEIPDAMLDSQVEDMISNYRMQLAQQGIPFDEYLKMMGKTVEDLRKDMKPQAEHNIRTSLVLDAIQKAEGIEVSEDRVDAELRRIADQYKMKLEDFMKTVTDSQRKSVKRELEIQETIDFLVSEADLVDPAASA